jgi:multidrug resistance efflux pump
MKRPSSTKLLALAVAACIAPGASGCAARAEASKPPVRAPLAVVVERAETPEPLAIYTGPGAVAAAHTYRVAFEISGRVAAVNADVGDRVRAGETLAALNDTDYREELEAARARLDSAEAAAARAANGARPQERAQADESVASARAVVARAQAALDLARDNDARDQQLLGAGDIAAQTADTTHTAFVDAQAQLRSAQAQLAAAEANAALVAAGPRVEDRAAASADAAGARASAELAATTLAKTSIHAAADAFVLARDVERGDVAVPGAVAFTLTDAGPPDVLVDVPESLVSRIVTGMSARVSVDGRSGLGCVTRGEPAADDASRAVQVRVRVPQLALRPGAVVDVALGPRRPRAASVPAGAILTERGGTFVETYDARRATVALRAVRVLAADGDRAEVSGIATGTPVVVMGQHQAEPGDAVRVVSGS